MNDRRADQRDPDVATNGTSPTNRRELAGVIAQRGYYYQTLWTAVRWATLDRDTVLVVEGEEDIDRHQTVAGATPETIIEQIKLREGASTTSTTDAIKAAGNFLDAFERASDKGRRLTAVLRSSSPSPPTLQTDIRQWLVGGAIDHVRLAAALCEKLPTRAALINKLVSDGRFPIFCNSVVWCWSAPAFDDVEADLASVLAPFATQSLDVATLRAHVVHALVRRAVEPAIERRIVTKWDFEMLVNTLAMGPVKRPADPHEARSVLGLAVADEHLIAAVVHVVAPERLRASIERSAKRARLAAGTEPAGPGEQDLADADCVVLASVVPLSPNARRVAIRDVVRHASHRWDPPSIAVHPDVPQRQLPRGQMFRFSPVDRSDPLLALAGLIAAALADRVIRGRDVYPDLVPRLRWVHRMAEREYWTAATRPRFLRE